MGAAKTVNAGSFPKLPPVARRLIAKNKERRAVGGGFAGDFDKTLRYLRWKQACNSLGDAVSYLETELHRERLLAFYQKLFPRDWKCSQASFELSGASDYHTERELEFIELISERFFPLNSWLDWTDFRFDHIPIEPVNFDFCCDEYEWQDLRPCLQFGVAAFLWRDANDENYLNILDNFKVRARDLPTINQTVPSRAELDANADDPKVQRFLHLVEFIFHDSGNPFVDTTYCQPFEFFEWSLENLEKLKTEYKAVDSYLASMASIDASIERDAFSTFRELIEIWNTGCVASNNEQNERIKAQRETDGLLINILTDYDSDAAKNCLNF